MAGHKSFFYSHQRICSLIFRDKKRKKNIDVREKHQSVASRTCPNPGLNMQPFGV